MMKIPGYVRTSARKIPIQSRSRVAVSSILEAAARILEAGDLAYFNTNAIAESAGVSVGTLYQYFPDKSAVLTGLIESEIDRSLQAMEKSASSADIGSKVEYALAAMVMSLQSRAALSQVLLVNEPLLFMDGDRTPFEERMLERFSVFVREDTGCGRCDKAITLQLVGMSKGLLLEASLRDSLLDTGLAQRISRLGGQLVADSSHSDCGRK